MRTSDSLLLQRGSDARTLCPRCGEPCLAETMSCPTCGAELGGETVLDDARHTANGSPVVSRTAATLASVAGRADEDLDRLTSVVFRRRHAPSPTPSAGSSSDPKTKFLRGVDQHIELPAGSLVDEYEIDARLGAGAMGVVYSARHVKIGRRVAIKVIAPSMGTDPQALARFEREARALASLHHPNIVDVHAFGTLPDDRSYFVMEHLSGTALDERLERGRVPVDEALDVLDQMSRALEAAHTQGIVHRDLKPSNTFLQRLPNEQRPVVKLLDFGLVKLAIADGVEKTASGIAMGTPMYMSPEQARGPNVDHRTDIYALGCIAYELVLGRRPFPDARIPTAVLAAHLTEPPPHPRTIWPEIPAALDLLMHSMLAKDPKDRPTLAHVRSVIASVQSSTATADRAMRAATTPVASPTGTPRSRALMSVRSPAYAARARSAAVSTDETRASRRVFLALAGLTVLGAIIIAAVVARGGASVGEPGRIEEPRSAIEIDASVPPATTATPSVVLDANVPLATLALPVDASAVTPRSNVEPGSPSVARPLVDGRARGSKAAAVVKPDPKVAEVVEPDPKPAPVDTAVPDAGVESEDGDESEASPTSPPSRRTPQVPNAKKPPKRNVISDPFNKKEITK